MNIRLYIIGFALLIIINSGIAAEQKFSRIENLNGLWKFNLGDNKMWANPNYNDSDWDPIKVPSRWEDEGYNGYDGYAWYRKEFDLNVKNGKNKLYLSLGVIDDVAEIYLNGKLIATSGSFPPNFRTAYNLKIWIPLQISDLAQNGKNIIAIRVFDEQLDGGIYNGDIGIFTNDLALNFIANFEGYWKFRTGDNSSWLKNNFDDRDWKSIIVPSTWEQQGFDGYDGFAWYRITFNINLEKDFESNDLVLMAGKIDDIDETFLNEKKVGSTGDVLAMPLIKNFSNGDNNEYKQLRGYKINKADLRSGKNVIAVRVYDGFQYGGIYEGPVGIVTLKNYIRYITKNTDLKKKNFIEKLFE